MSRVQDERPLYPTRFMPHGPSVLNILVHRPDAAFDRTTRKHVVGLTGLCAGFDDEKWRCSEFAEYLIDTWLPEFALRYSELTNVHPRYWGRLLRSAARAVYRTEKFKNRGEFGEMLLLAALCEVFETLPAISKVYFKDTPNETVKGFDAVHVLLNEEGLELWLGEAKFYGNISDAIRSAIESLELLGNRRYLRDEFAAIVHKIDDRWPHANRLKGLLDPAIPLDRIFSAVCVPVLLTYDSAVLAAHAEDDDCYRAAIAAEWERYHLDFSGRKLPNRVKVHLFLMPLNTKDLLVEALDKQLRRWDPN